MSPDVWPMEALLLHWIFLLTFLPDWVLSCLILQGKAWNQNTEGEVIIEKEKNKIDIRIEMEGD